jgi:glutathione S-transferase
LAAITLWGRASSANVQKVRWCLGELGLPYEHVPLGGKYGGNRSADYLALNPNGLVPTLRDGGVVVWESYAIVRYLCAQYATGTLFPAAPADRAVVDQWTDWAATTFQPAWIDVFWAVVRTRPSHRDAAVIAGHIARTEVCFAIMEQRLQQAPFLGGEALTYADIVAGVAMFRWETMPIERRRHPAVEAWHARLKARPAFREAVEVDYSELAGSIPA